MKTQLHFVQVTWLTLVVVQSPLPHHLAIPEPASIVFLLALQEQLAGVTGHFSCLWTRALSWDDQDSLTVPDTSATCLVKDRTTWSEEHQNYPIVGTNCFTWPGWKLTDQSQSSWDPISSGTKESPLSSPGAWQAVPSTLSLGGMSLRALWTSRLPGLNYRDPSLLEARPSPIEKIIWSEYFTELEGHFNRYP